MSLQPLGVLGRGGLSVMGGHLGTVVRCAYIVSGFMEIEPNVNGECVWKRGNPGMGSIEVIDSPGPVSQVTSHAPVLKLKPNRYIYLYLDFKVAYISGTQPIETILAETLAI